MKNILHFGVRGHDYGTMDADTLAGKIQAAGFDLVQLAVQKALDRKDLGPGQFNSSKATEIAASFERHGVKISVLGCYINPVDADETKRQAGIERFKEHLGIATFMGSPVVGTETGWVGSEGNNLEQTRNPRTLSLFLGGLEGLLDHAKSFNARIAIEGVVRHSIWNPRLMGEVLKRYQVPELCAIYDPVNYIDIGNWRSQDRLINEAFDSYGDRMAILHAKDFKLIDDKVQTCPAGTGQLNWSLVLRRMQAVVEHLGKPIATLLEDTKPQDQAQARKNLEHLTLTL